MVVEKVTKEMLFSIEVDEEKTFTLPCWGLARSAQSYAHQQKKATLGTPDQCEFVAKIVDHNKDTGQWDVIIKRIA